MMKSKNIFFVLFSTTIIVFLLLSGAAKAQDGSKHISEFFPKEFKGYSDTLLIYVTKDRWEKKYKTKFEETYTGKYLIFDETEFKTKEEKKVIWKASSGNLMAMEGMLEGTPYKDKKKYRFMLVSVGEISYSNPTLQWQIYDRETGVSYRAAYVNKNYFKDLENARL